MHDRAEKHHHPAKPLTNTYWVVPGRFLAGEYPGDLSAAASRQKIESLIEAGIDVFIDLTEDREAGGYLAHLRGKSTSGGRPVAHRRLAIPDFGIPTVANMRDILDTIDRALDAGHRVYLHCWGGVGRTGTVVGCWLVRHGHAGVQALAEVDRLFRTMPKSDYHRNSPESEEQEEFVLSWAEHDAGRPARGE